MSSIPPGFLVEAPQKFSKAFDQMNRSLMPSP
jgi:hypothetical protein